MLSGLAFCRSQASGKADRGRALTGFSVGSGSQLGWFVLYLRYENGESMCKKWRIQ